MSGMAHVPAGPAFLSIVLLATGCATDWEAERQSVAGDHRDRIQAETREILAAHPDGLDLEACLAIARTRNSRLLGGELAARMARLDTRAAFSAFLPMFQVSWESLSLSQPPAKRFNDSTIVMQDQDVTQSSFQIVQPLFAPGAWLMYRTARRGAEMAELAHERAAQMLELSVVSLYFDCLTAAGAVAFRDEEQAAAAALRKEGEALATAGFLDEAALKQARLAEQTGAFQADRARRALADMKSRLLQAMNLWPLAEWTLRAEPSIPLATVRVCTPGLPARELAIRTLADQPVEDWLWHALLSRPDMRLQDRNVALRRNETIRALLFFVPNLMGFANYYQTSDSFTVNTEYWATGLQATLASLIGFRDIAAYQKARRQEETAAIEREDTAMMILLQVIEARHRLKDAAGSVDVARAGMEAAGESLRTVEALHRVEQARPVAVLEARAAAAKARLSLQMAERGHQVALRAFLTALGGNVELISKENP